MSDEKTDLNVQVVDEPDLNAPVVEEQDLTTPVVEEPSVLADGTTEDKTVKYSEFKKANDEKNVAIAAKEAAEAQAQNLTSQFEAMQAQGQQNTQPQPKSPASFFKEKFGLEGEDLANVDQTEAYINYRQQLDAVATQQSNAVAKNQRFISGKKDFAEKVGVFSPNGFVYSDTFQKAMAADADLAQSNFEGSLTIQAAYTAVKAFETGNELAVMKATAKEQKAQKDVALKTGPLSPAAVGGTGSVNQGLNAGLDPNTPAGREAILANFESMREGDYDDD